MPQACAGTSGFSRFDRYTCIRMDDGVWHIGGFRCLGLRWKCCINKTHKKQKERDNKQKSPCEPKMCATEQLHHCNNCMGCCTHEIYARAKCLCARKTSAAKRMHRRKNTHDKSMHEQKIREPFVCLYHLSAQCRCCSFNDVSMGRQIYGKAIH